MDQGKLTYMVQKSDGGREEAVGARRITPFKQLRFGQWNSASGEDGWDKESFPVWFRTLLEVEEKQWESGGPTGMAGRSEYLGFTHRSQPAVGNDIPQ